MRRGMRRLGGSDPRLFTRESPWRSWLDSQGVVQLLARLHLLQQSLDGAVALEVRQGAGDGAHGDAEHGRRGR